MLVDYSSVGEIDHVVRYGSKRREFARGKNTIELGGEAEAVHALAKVREAAYQCD